jgi:dTDP-4-dehydrorhamnose reductase
MVVAPDPRREICRRPVRNRRVKVLVTGREGQIAKSLLERGAPVPELDLIALGRPELDLERPGQLSEPIRALSPDVVINAAAYTAVDQAEDEPERARIVNADAAGAIAAAARNSGARVIQISTDYVFDGTATGAYCEDAPTSPLGVYGRTKCEGEERVRAEAPDHLILRTAWVYSPFGKNFVRTMMSIAESRDTVSVVADQHGNPTSALDLADGLITVLQCWRDGDTGLGGTYHLAGTGVTSWCGFAEGIFEQCRVLGMPAALVEPIATAAWPTRTPRPRNSALDCGRFLADFGFRMPDWRPSVGEVVGRLASAR